MEKQRVASSSRNLGSVAGRGAEQTENGKGQTATLDLAKRCRKRQRRARRARKAPGSGAAISASCATAPKTPMAAKGPKDQRSKGRRHIDLDDWTETHACAEPPCSAPRPCYKNTDRRDVLVYGSGPSLPWIHPWRATRAGPAAPMPHGRITAAHAWATYPVGLAGINRRHWQCVTTAATHTVWLARRRLAAVAVPRHSGPGRPSPAPALSQAPPQCADSAALQRASALWWPHAPAAWMSPRCPRCARRGPSFRAPREYVDIPLQRRREGRH